MASAINSTPSTVKVALHRLRTRFGAVLREAVAETVDDAADIDREIQDLLQYLSC